MNSDRIIYWPLTWPYIIFLYFNLTALTYRVPFYSSSQLTRRYFGELTPTFPKVAEPISINYKLDAWSQYDNPEEGNHFEGDIKMDARKTSTTHHTALWPNGIVRYYVDRTIANYPSKLAVLIEAMNDISAKTCVRFLRIYPNMNGKLPHHTWVNITGNEPGCFSDLGRSNLSPSNINLNIRRCFRTKGHAIHEILHTLGVFHEHMRPDRDHYIKILWNNIKDGSQYNFRIMDKSAVTTYGLPYDYDSIMHYSMTAFSKDRSHPSIIPRKIGAAIGQRNHLSSYDVLKLLLTYNCINLNSKYHHNQVDDMEFLNSNTSIDSAAKPIKRKKIYIVPVKMIRDFLYAMRPHPSTIPITSNSCYEFHYSKYLSNSHPTNCYYYDY